MQKEKDDAKGEIKPLQLARRFQATSFYLPANV